MIMGLWYKLNATDLNSYVHTNISINDLLMVKQVVLISKFNDINSQSSTGTLNNAEYNVGLGYGVFDALTSGDRTYGWC